MRHFRPGGAVADEREKRGRDDERQVADGGDVGVVLFSVEEHGRCADEPGEADDGVDGALLRVNRWHDAVGLAFEERGFCDVDARGLFAGHGVSADEVDVRRQEVAGPSA